MHFLVMLLCMAAAGAGHPPNAPSGQAARATGSATPPATREDQIEQERRDRIAHMQPIRPGALERFSSIVAKSDLYQRTFGDAVGWRILVGSLPSNSGFALGPEYYRPDLVHGDVVFQVFAEVSTEHYELDHILLGFPHLLHDHAFADFSGQYSNYGSVDYYGPGPQSREAGRSDYRLEETTFTFSAGLQLPAHFRVGLRGGYLAVNVGPGGAPRLISTDRQYSPATTPGIDRQSDFLRGAPFIQFDTRDNPGDPHSGANYFASYTYYDDTRLNVSNFRELDAEGQQYFPFFNKKRVIALRARAQLTYPNANQVVPFYLQPQLGGSDDLRGFRPFRFYDDNSLLMTAEYRWDVMAPLEMAVFVDSGKVFHSASQFDFADLETDAGFGFRIRNRSAVLMRADFGFSREGYQVWLKFANIF
jgi:Omp85 superfamily domain